MGVIYIDSLSTGMVLDKDVAARNGRILLRKGESLAKNHIQTFKAWGVTEAEILEDENSQTKSATEQTAEPDLYQKTARKTLERFCYFRSDHPFFEELVRVVTTRTIQNTQK